MEFAEVFNVLSAVAAVLAIVASSMKGLFKFLVTAAEFVVVLGALANRALEHRLAWHARVANFFAISLLYIPQF